MTVLYDRLSRSFPWSLYTSNEVLEISEIVRPESSYADIFWDFWTCGMSMHIFPVPEQASNPKAQYEDMFIDEDSTNDSWLGFQVMRTTCCQLMISVAADQEFKPRCCSNHSVACVARDSNWKLQKTDGCCVENLSRITNLVYVMIQRGKFHGNRMFTVGLLLVFPIILTHSLPLCCVQVKLLIVDELHLLDSDVGPILEAVVSRMRYISVQLQPIRIVAMAASLANAKDVAEWIGVTSSGLFNFSPKVRTVPLEMIIQGFDQHHRGTFSFEQVCDLLSNIGNVLLSIGANMVLSGNHNFCDI